MKFENLVSMRNELQFAETSVFCAHGRDDAHELDSAFDVSLFFIRVDMNTKSGFSHVHEMEAIIDAILHTNGVHGHRLKNMG